MRVESYGPGWLRSLRSPQHREEKTSQTFREHGAPPCLQVKRPEPKSKDRQHQQAAAETPQSTLSTLHANYRLHYTEQSVANQHQKSQERKKEKKGSLKFPKTILNLSSNPAMPAKQSVANQKHNKFDVLTNGTL